MAEDRPEPTERTPKRFEVRVPKRREFFDNLKKIAGPRKRDDSATRRPKQQ